jgi:hypothetical protein
VSASRSNQQIRSVSLGSKPCRSMQCSRNRLRHSPKLVSGTPITIGGPTANVSRLVDEHKGLRPSCSRRARLLCGISESVRNGGQPSLLMFGIAGMMLRKSISGTWVVK